MARLSAIPPKPIQGGKVRTDRQPTFQLPMMDECHRKPPVSCAYLPLLGGGDRAPKSSSGLLFSHMGGSNLSDEGDNDYNIGEAAEDNDVAAAAAAAADGARRDQEAFAAVFRQLACDIGELTEVGRRNKLDHILID